MKISRKEISKKEISNMRHELGMSQSEFAKYFGIPIKTIQKWEQGIYSPPPYIISLIRRVLILENKIKKGDE